MAYELEGRNICIEYQFEEEPDPATSSGVDPQFSYGMSTNLAYRLFPDFGRGMKPDPILKTQADASLSNMSARTAFVNTVRRPDRQAAGSGNTFRWNRWRRFFRDGANVVVSCETITMQLNTAKDDTQSWVNQLGDLETISSFEIESTNGLTIVSSSIGSDSQSIDYRVSAIKCGAQTVTISIVTSDSTPYNADVRTVNFNVLDNATRDN